MNAEKKVAASPGSKAATTYKRSDSSTARALAARPAMHLMSTAKSCEWLKKTLGTGLLSSVLDRDGELVWCVSVGEDGYVPPRDGDDGPGKILLITPQMLTARIQYLYWWYDTKKDAPESAMFPGSATRAAIDAPDLLDNPQRLRGVTHTPIVCRDGSVLSEPGYDRETGILYAPGPGLVVEKVPERPPGEMVAAAVALVDQMLAGFPFVTKSDRANFIGFLITPLLRELVPPPYKLGAVGAPQPGSGKTLLVTILRIIHGGVFRSETPEDDAEMRKAISTILDQTTAPVVHIDNVSGILRSSTLSGLLTSPVWEDRRLGSNTMISRKNDRLWVITGNNLALGGDLIRRTVWVTIDPGRPNPELRTGFAIPNLEEWVAENRGRIIHALLVLIRAWIAAGSPTTVSSSDGYSKWVSSINGILSVAGVPGTFDDKETARQTVGVDDDEWREFLEAAHREFGGDGWTVKELLARVDTSTHIASATGWIGGERKPIPAEALPAELAEKLYRSSQQGAGVIAKSLGRWLANREGRWAGGFAVRRSGEDSSTKVARWRIDVNPGSPRPNSAP